MYIGIMWMIYAIVRHKAGFSDKFWWIYKEVFVMKTWRTPEMKVYSVKMDENIANSGANSGAEDKVEYENVKIYYGEGNSVIQRLSGTYKCTATGFIHDSGIKYKKGNQYTPYYVDFNQQSAISGCIA